MPKELVAKILQRLAKIGLASVSARDQRRIRFGKNPSEINAFEVIRALEGPLFITSCVTDRRECHQMTTCTVREPLRKVNDAIVKALRDVTVSSLIGETAGFVQIQVEGGPL